MAKTPIDVTESSTEELKKAFKEKTPMIGIKKFGVHPRIHNDENVAILLLQDYGDTPGNALFPDIKKCAIGFITNKIVEKFKKDDLFWELLKLGILPIGCCGGPFDDHGNDNDCATTLVAKYLGIEKKPELRQILEYSLYTDKNGDAMFGSEKDTFTFKERLARNAAQALLPAGLCKSANRYIPIDDYEQIEKMIHVFIEMLRFKIKEQIAYHKVRSEIKESKPWEMHSFNENEVDHKIIIIFHSSPFAAQIVRELNQNLKPMLVIIINPETRHIALLNSQKNPRNIEGFVRYIRMSWFFNKRRSTPNWSEVGKTEDLEGAPFLFYHKEAENFYNGGHTQPDADGYFGSVISKQN